MLKLGRLLYNVGDLTHLHVEKNVTNHFYGIKAQNNSQPSSSSLLHL